MACILTAAARFSGITARAFDLADLAYDLEEQGKDIIHLSVGDPDFDTPAPIVDSAIASLTSGRTHYAPIAGNPRLRKSIAAHASTQYGQTVQEEQVIVFSGAQNALFATMMCVAQTGDEILLVEPAYTTYDAAASAGGASPVRVALSAENNFQLDVSLIAAAITSRTQAILINSPGNPSGVVFERDRIADLVALCDEKGIWLISDEVYWPYIYNGQHASPYSESKGPSVSFIVNSLSKSHAMTGWRIGWTIAPLDVAHHLIDLAQCMLFGVNQFVQDAALTALDSDIPELLQIRKAFHERRDCLCAGLQSIPNLKAYPPDGGMFLLVDVSQTKLNGYEFAEKLLHSVGVSVVPGFGFGESLTNFVRIGYLSDTPVLKDAITRIEKFVKSIE